MGNTVGNTMNGVEHPHDVEAIRTRIQKMTDEELLRYGVVAQYLCSPERNDSQPPRDALLMQLREARAEWRRRHPEPCVIADSF
jgi:hypothetical protein